ncbi:hypothetical protein [Burkholderia gladioli]|uniref:hypothetical protein n=1 Tax=Burkholderia gladioli TaxID=28095 RepID=UPI001640A217|nr:hypothetical protein [Burkholderia gladioli]
MERNTNTAGGSVKKIVTELDIKWAEAALYFEKRGESGPLAELMRSNVPVSDVVRPLLAKIITGELKLPDQRGRSNSTLNWKAKKQIADGLGKVYRNSEIVLCFADELADELRRETIDIRRDMEAVRRAALKAIESRYDLTESGVRKIANLSVSIAFGRAISGIDPKEFEDTWLMEFAELSAVHRDSTASFARSIYESRGDFFDPLAEGDVVPNWHGSIQ